ncbi:secondary thiamine-phosphate synthase enzyme YjbQ [Croceicoccus gelatinilyticus]|uniref:secondary thiamine-phosphate synthase enzyme YjbQ n=1 Tax=Croceicoccus gelatinilyticus TaxID=2835536 RepID=UPI001BCC3598|nr:secondary thiamine-phosphate synthase enzyme YjbQ [Croceicoccus gelatinilyticus]MBS7670881.1 secondary thiamine-phosphate synthase enzyme YjbQ [Croceicoccus gelatinilyticus]
MRQSLTPFDVRTGGRGLIEITREVSAWVADSGIDVGLLTVFCRHTSASLTIQENAAPEVRQDIVDWLDRIAPEDSGWVHDDEGPDDMPAHLKSILTGVSLSIPVASGRPTLGTWQGIYLVEHRTRPHTRQVDLHLLGE